MRVRTGVAVAALLLTAGCGPRAVPAGPAQGETAPASAGAECGTAAEVTVTAADNGRHVCLDRRGTVRVRLPGTPAVPVTVSGTALAEVSDHLYRGVSAGTAVLASAVPVCASPAGPGGVRCLAVTAWQVTVVVR
ncbi:hypothetical protein Slala03_57090 [Streptomyces lavendulae subsp. lavendulae]|uniref:hypothetical protein n=1 Tax=Streptomyces lavendulae TaxID=1914 RepID=UPI0024A0955E|nr:hypothetical protein [Streptomyces lavendulae]GLV86020.1 hypothetical protein Slala03_57090 [Streptomyces lavendulae subsp. lavendulae]